MTQEFSEAAIQRCSTEQPFQIFWKTPRNTPMLVFALTTVVSQRTGTSPY